MSLCLRARYPSVILAIIALHTLGGGVMAINIDNKGRLDWEVMVPGERVKVHCDQSWYTFKMGPSSHMVLEPEASCVPIGLITYIKRCRDVQEVERGQDIEIDNMQVYLHHSEDLITPKEHCTLCANEALSDIKIHPESGAFYTGNISWIEPLTSNEPNTA